MKVPRPESLGMADERKGTIKGIETREGLFAVLDDNHHWAFKQFIPLNNLMAINISGIDVN